MTPEVIIDLVVGIAGVLTLIIAIWTFWQSVKVNRDSNYIMAESSSIDVFKMIIENADLSKLYADASSFKRSEIDPALEIKMKEYASIVLNLFEIQFQLRKSKSIDAVRFASWVPWILSLTKGYYFRQFWTEELRLHYVPEFRSMIDEVIQDSKMSDEQLYGVVSRYFDGCKIIKNWMKS